MRMNKKKEGRSKLVMKNKTTGRKSNSLIHCIPQFSQVMPSHTMTVARRALLQKIESKGNENKAEERNTDYASEDWRRISANDTNSCASNNLPPPELTIEAISRNFSGRDFDSKTEESASQCQFIVPEISIFPKYPSILHTIPRSSSFIATCMSNLVVPKESFEKLSQINPFFSGYIFLPKLNFFVHPFVVSKQFPWLNPSMDTSTDSLTTMMTTDDKT